MTAFAEDLRERVHEVTGGLTASVGVASSKFVAKVASDLDKPDGLVVVAPGTELDLLRPMHVSVIPGVGPATVERLRRVGAHTIADLQQLSEDELVRMLGKAHGHVLHDLAFARDDRQVEAERETKSVSVEGTYEQDLTDRKLMESLLTRQAADVARRLRKNGMSGRTVTIKVRLYDFTTLNRSTTLPSPTDDEAVIGRLARRLLEDLDTSGGVRLLGVGVSGLADWVQEELFGSRGRRRGRRSRRRVRHCPGAGPDSTRRTAARRPDRRLPPRHGRRPRRARPGLGVGRRQGRGDRAVRDRRDPARPGPARSRSTTRPWPAGGPRLPTRRRKRNPRAMWGTRSRHRGAAS